MTGGPSMTNAKAALAKLAQNIDHANIVIVGYRATFGVT